MQSFSGPEVGGPLLLNGAERIPSNLTLSVFGMDRYKLFAIVLICSIVAAVSCSSSHRVYMIGESKSYDASLFRQHCAICHGTEGLGRTLADGTKVPSLRTGEFKAVSRDQIYVQITNGGNGMLSFRDQLTERERNMMSDLVYHELRGN